ncbi:MAG: hypothetical protein GF335_04435 [Candidatus Moranbacteria bacterium]|nr:hypothetical protein [Candidatus Moranbacteria bacterium]
MKRLDQIFQNLENSNKYSDEEREKEEEEERLSSIDEEARKKVERKKGEPENKRIYSPESVPPGEILEEETLLLDSEFPYNPSEDLDSLKVDDLVYGGVPDKPDEFSASKLEKQKRYLEEIIYARLANLKNSQEYPVQADKEIQETFDLIRNFTVNKFNKQKFEIKKELARFKKTLEDNRIFTVPVCDFEKEIADIFEKILSPDFDNPDFSDLDARLDNFFKNSKTPDFYSKSGEKIYKNLKSEIKDCFYSSKEFMKKLNDKKHTLRKKLSQINFKNSFEIIISEVDDLIREILSFN